MVGPASFQSEYIHNSVHQPNGGDASFGSFYLQGSYFLTGEQRPYRDSGGHFNRVKPLHNLGDRNGWGAWEIALRYSQLDLNDRPDPWWAAARCDPRPKLVSQSEHSLHVELRIRRPRRAGRGSLVPDPVSSGFLTGCGWIPLFAPPFAVDEAKGRRPRLASKFVYIGQRPGMSGSGRDESRPYVPDGGHLLSLLPAPGEKYGRCHKS